jgi:hypothetical protein
MTCNAICSQALNGSDTGIKYWSDFGLLNGVAKFCDVCNSILNALRKIVLEQSKHPANTTAEEVDSEIKEKLVQNENANMHLKISRDQSMLIVDVPAISDNPIMINFTWITGQSTR